MFEVTALAYTEVQHCLGRTESLEMEGLVLNFSVHNDSVKYVIQVICAFGITWGKEKTFLLKRLSW